MRIESIQRHRVERGRQALGRHVPRQEFEAGVGAERIAFAREHPRWVFVLALEREHAGGIRKIAGQVFPHQPFERLAVVLELRQGHFRDLRAGQRRRLQRRADLAIADLGDLLVARISLPDLRPFLQQRPRVGAQGLVALRDERLEVRSVLFRGLEHAPGFAQLLAFARRLGLPGDVRVIVAHRLRDFREIARAGRRNDDVLSGRRFHARGLQFAVRGLESAGLEFGDDGLVERGHSVVVEPGRDGAEHRHGVGGDIEGATIALHLLAHVAQCVLRPTPVEFVAGGAEFRRHHVE